MGLSHQRSPPSEWPPPKGQGPSLLERLVAVSAALKPQVDVVALASALKPTAPAAPEEVLAQLSQLPRAPSVIAANDEIFRTPPSARSRKLPKPPCWNSGTSTSHVRRAERPSSISLVRGWSSYGDVNSESSWCMIVRSCVRVRTRQCPAAPAESQENDRTLAKHGMLSHTTRFITRHTRFVARHTHTHMPHASKHATHTHATHASVCVLSPA